MPTLERIGAYSQFEFFLRAGRRPDIIERQGLWDVVKRDYQHLTPRRPKAK